MKDIICIKVGADHSCSCNTRIIAREGESLTTQLQISLADELCDYWVYVDFKKPSGETFKTPRLEITDKVVNYDVPLSLLDEKGTLEVQLVLQKESGEIWKSEVCEYFNRRSINGTDDIPEKEDFITNAQKTIDEAVEIAESIEERANNGDFKGEKGDKGDAGSIEFKVVDELPTENISESILYLVPIINDDDLNNYLEYIYVDGRWECIDTVSFEGNLDDYLKKTELDYAVKTSITANTYTLTNEEKASACEWLGASSKVKTVKFSNGDTLIVEDNTEYIAETDISNITVVYPNTNFICSLFFKLASEGDITITLPESKYIGGKPLFANGQTWELNIKNGVVVGGIAE